MTSLPVFEAIRNRQSAREFSAQPIRDQVLYELLDLANRAPSGYNLQPWHFVLVRDSELRGLLHHIALGQPAIARAPVTVVFVADPDAWKESYPRILEESFKVGAVNEEDAVESFAKVNELFRLGPLGIFGFVKKLSLPLKRISKPAPQTITTPAEASHYVRAQTMLAAATFMLAASGAGLATSPIEAFDEDRLKKLLAIPKHMSVPIIIAVGYPAAVQSGRVVQSFRLPIIEKLSVDLFPNKLSRVKQQIKKT